MNRWMDRWKYEGKRMKRRLMNDRYRRDRWVDEEIDDGMKD